MREKRNGNNIDWNIAGNTYGQWMGVRSKQDKNSDTHKHGNDFRQTSRHKQHPHTVSRNAIRQTSRHKQHPRTVSRNAIRQTSRHKQHPHTVSRNAIRQTSRHNTFALSQGTLSDKHQDINNTLALSQGSLSDKHQDINNTLALSQRTLPDNHHRTKLKQKLVRQIYPEAGIVEGEIEEITTRDIGRDDGENSTSPAAGLRLRGSFNLPSLSLPVFSSLSVFDTCL
ncbi:hypothetical protein ElyMa_002473500 [Elysia marginata]|uniref:Uncharacterized protein n=1 Tax=Elysia marginata TaxID=1093978 RepID=A0AAV4GP28_9GAST|nr:hypothetical protein ElyMa_002473500 [Elysia marginata]